MRRILALAVLCVSAPSLAEVSAWAPIDTSEGQVIVPVTLNGKPARAMLDTGAIGNTVSRAFLDGLGMQPDSMAGGLTMAVAGTEFAISELGADFLNSYDLVIGLPFLETSVVQIDYPGQRIRVMDRDSIDMKKLANVKMRRAPGTVKPQVRVAMNGKVKAWLMFDTGNSGLLMYSRTNAQRRGWLEEYPVSVSEVADIDYVPVGADLFRLPMVTIGPFEVEDVLVGVLNSGSSTGGTSLRDLRETGNRLQKGGRKPPDGTLGFDILQHYIVTLDLKRNRLSLDETRPASEAP